MADFGSGGAAVVTAYPAAMPTLGELVYIESAAPVEVAPGATEKIVAHTESDDNWVLMEIGASDHDLSEYWLQIDVVESQHTKEPFGLFNAPKRFEPGFSIPKAVEVAYYVTLDAAATAAVEYVGKFIGYIP